MNSYSPAWRGNHLPHGGPGSHPEGADVAVGGSVAVCVSEVPLVAVGALVSVGTAEGTLVLVGTGVETLVEVGAEVGGADVGARGKTNVKVGVKVG